MGLQRGEVAVAVLPPRSKDRLSRPNLSPQKKRAGRAGPKSNSGIEPRT